MFAVRACFPQDALRPAWLNRSRTEILLKEKLAVRVLKIGTMPEMLL